MSIFTPYKGVNIDSIPKKRLDKNVVRKTMTFYNTNFKINKLKLI